MIHDLATPEVLRLAVFLAVALTMAGWEALAPRRAPSQGRVRRWPRNLGLAAAGAVLVRLVFPAALIVGVAAWGQQNGIGLLRLVNLPAPLTIAAAVVLLDLVIWGQHVVFHHVGLLWRLHRVHHLDLDFDFTTGVRFHPVEILLSVVIKMAAVVALGAPATAVMIFEIVLNASAMFNHGNVRLPAGMDRVLRTAVVTPDMHRVHHSIVPAETHSNFGFCLSIWDRLFGTYRPRPGAGHDAMTIGLPAWRAAEDQGFIAILVNPVRTEPGSADDKANKT